MNIYIKSKTITYLQNGKIKGTLKLSDKSTTKFEIEKDGQWFQWGNTENNLWISVPLVKKLREQMYNY
jgi:hypothetical protein